MQVVVVDLVNDVDDDIAVAAAVTAAAVTAVVAVDEITDVAIRIVAEECPNVR